jgi:hypothetical protein
MAWVDRMADQSKARQQRSLWASSAVDAEQDDCDCENTDPDECKLQPAVMA